MSDSERIIFYSKKWYFYKIRLWIVEFNNPQQCWHIKSTNWIDVVNGSLINFGVLMPSLWNNMMSQDHFRWLKPKSRLLVVQHPHRLTVSPPRLWWSHRGVETACPGYFLLKAIPKTISTTKTLEQNDQVWTSFAQLPGIKQNEHSLQQLTISLHIALHWLQI